MNNKIQCPICGNTNNIFLDNNSLKLLKLRHPGLLFSNKERKHSANPVFPPLKVLLSFA